LEVKVLEHDRKFTQFLILSAQSALIFAILSILPSQLYPGYVSNYRYSSYYHRKKGSLGG